MDKLRIGIIGFGTVGKGVYQILKGEKDTHPILKQIEIVNIVVKNISKKREVNLEKNLLINDPNKLIDDPSIDVIVEVMGGTDIAKNIILKSLRNGKSVVTANKAVMARYGEEIHKVALENGAYILFEAAVCGGIPIIEPLKRSLKSNQIIKMAGIINGTTNFILSKMSTQKAAFNESLELAQELGYAELDPSADVEGEDAADKILILSDRYLVRPTVNVKTASSESLRDNLIQLNSAKQKALTNYLSTLSMIKEIRQKKFQTKGAEKYALQ